MKQIVLVNLGLLRLVSDSGEDISVEYVVADVVHEALACVLSVLAAIVVAVWQFVFPVRAKPHRPAAVSAFHQPKENM